VHKERNSIIEMLLTKTVIKNIVMVVDQDDLYLFFFRKWRCVRKKKKIKGKN